MTGILCGADRRSVVDSWVFTRSHLTICLSTSPSVSDLSVCESHNISRTFSYFFPSFLELWAFIIQTIYMINVESMRK